MTTRQNRNKMILRRRCRTAHRSQRRGVLLLIVLSILAMFMLVGAAFLLVGSSHSSSGKAFEKSNIASPQQGDLLDRALRQLLRDTHNRHSAIRFHSLLRDAYGTDGFVATVYAGAPADTNLADGFQPELGYNGPLTPTPLVSSYSSGVFGAELGPTGGQLIDIYLRDDLGATASVVQSVQTRQPLPPDFVIGLELSSAGLPVNHKLSPTNGYYNGCLLTMLSGPAKGQSARIVKYEYDPSENIARLRVVAFSRADGAPLQLSPDLSDENDLLYAQNTINGAAVFGHQFMVNGRPFNGSGVGLNLLSDPTGARLTAYEAIRDASGQAFDSGTGEFYGGPVGLLPNARYFSEAFESTYNMFRAQETNGTAIVQGYLDSLSSDPSLNAPNGLALYDLFPGPGGSDESYDAPDYQNMFLASMPLQPRSRGRVVDSSGMSWEAAAWLSSNNDRAPVRLNLDGLPIPSFHRPALVNYWLHRLANATWLRTAIPDVNDRAKAILQPYGADGVPGSGDEAVTMSPAVAAQIVAFKRKYTLRPLLEDHPSFTGGNPFVNMDLRTINSLVNGTTITFPSQEVTGPWDVDNDGDGVPDSIWVDLGLPVQTTEDGRKYKPLFAILVQDLDGKLNLNAHGSSEHLANDTLDRSNGQASVVDRDGTVQNVSLGSGNRANLTNGLAARASRAAGYTDLQLASSNQLPTGSGWGPADITLRPVLSSDILPGDWREGDPLRDDLARLLVGRPSESQDVTGSPTSSVTGRHGSIETLKHLFESSDSNYNLPLNAGNEGAYVAQYVKPGVSRWRDQLLEVELFDYPLYTGDLFPSRHGSSSTPSGFGSLPDLTSRYSVGLGYAGQPVEEGANDPASRWVSGDSPYELDLSRSWRSTEPSADLTLNILSATPRPTSSTAGVVHPTALVNDDAPFSPGDLERLLRAHDADASRLPDRLWELTDAFDPAKLVGVSNPSPGQLLTAQIEADQRRRSVTTESFDIPSTNENWTQRLVVGADGLPGLPEDDTDLAWVDPSADLSTAWDAGIDDYVVVMHEAAPANARLLDYLRYRVVLELKKQDPTTYLARPASDPVLVRAVDRVIYGDNALGSNRVRADRYSFGGLLAPEVLAGLKMDLNRPFGDGKDNGDGIDNDGNGLVDDVIEFEQGLDPYMNGVVDEPFEAGEAYVVGGSHLESNGIPGFQPAIDRMWAEDSNNSGALDAGEYTPFDHANGQDANGRGAYVTAPGVDDIRDDGRMARQLYARHLYCLAMLVKDENYLAPYDANDPQVVDYLDPDARPNKLFGKGGSPAYLIAQELAGNTDFDNPVNASPEIKAEAVRIARHKLTCRRLAQWAINCADMRDPDAICTPFEYDENPWDGWNVVSTSRRLQVYPLDGDVGTDENQGDYRLVSGSGWQDIDGTAVASPDQTRGVVWGLERPELLITETLAFHDRRVEDLAFQDVSIDTFATDDNGDQISERNLKLSEELTDQDEEDGVRRDYTMDQRLRPEGGAFIELFNPWSRDGQLPAELYSTVTMDMDGDGDQDTRTGVKLGRVAPVGLLAYYEDGSRVMEDANGQTVRRGSSDGVRHRIRYSPIWRLIAVEDHPHLRNDDRLDDAEGTFEDMLPKVYEPFESPPNPKMQLLRRGRIEKPLESRARLVDPDFPTFDQDIQPTLLRRPRILQRSSLHPETPYPGQIERFQFHVPRHYVERAFYFTSYDDAVRNPTNLRVRIPRARMRVSTTAIPQMWQSYLRDSDTQMDLLWPDGIGISEDGKSVEIYNHHFVAGFSELFEADATSGDPDSNPDYAAEWDDINLAPVLPGRFCVVGTAGYSYVQGRVSGVKKYPGRFITPIGRRNQRIYGPDLDRNMPIGQEDDGHGTRRIELVPSPNPEAHQVLVGENGGNESILIDSTGNGEHDVNLTNLFRDTVANDIQIAVDNGTVRTGPAMNNPARRIQPAIAIPIKGMSLSAPVDNYLLRWMELEPGSGPGEPGRVWDTNAGGGEGAYFARDPNQGSDAPFDEPFDLPRELIENHTTPNYRSVHLQRLANPMLPWNPPPGQDDHHSDVPVNPYITVDGASVDLTTFNGVDPKEQSLGEQGKRRDAPQSPAYPAQLHEYDAPLADEDRDTLMTLCSQQRGLHAVNIAVAEAPPANVLFQQEPPNILPEIDKMRLNGANTSTLLSPKLNMTQELTPRKHVLDFPVLHSLGFMNQPVLRSALQGGTIPDPNFFTQSDDQAYNSIDANGDGQAGDIVGTPKTNLSNTGDRDDDTYAALHWGNRPYASTLELLQTPAASNSTLTREFSTFNPNLGPPTFPFDATNTEQTNPYNGGASPADLLPATPTAAEEFAAAAVVNVDRYRAERGQFGHLANLFSTSTLPAAVKPITDGEQFAVSTYGSANLHRLLGYLRVPSRFVATQTTLNPTLFNNFVNSGANDPRNEWLAPFNRVDQYREPGKVNLNTVVGQVTTEPRRNALVLASRVYDGLMHRVADQNPFDNNGTPNNDADDELLQLGHRGPAWRDVVISRRGYVDPVVGNAQADTSMMSLHKDVPTFFSSPFRESEEGQLVPLDTLIRAGAEATLLRSHPFTPGEDGAWGNAGRDDQGDDDQGDGVRDDASEAGLGDDDDLFVDSTGLLENYVVASRPISAEKTRVPLFSAGTTEPALNSHRNAALRYQPMTRLSSMTTTRSGAFAIWITVGFFEVESADPWVLPDGDPNTVVQTKFLNSRGLYDRVYPDGYQLGKELGSDTGDTHRHRGFWIIDRTLPVGFRPGEDVNLEKMILVRRRIE